MVRITPTDGSLQAAKWAALLLMVVDHGANYLMQEPAESLRMLGRASMPLFAFVLGRNLARPQMLTAGGYKRVAGRLALCAALATFPFIALNEVRYGWWPLNIMATLLVAVGVAWLSDIGSRASQVCAGVLFAAGGALVEYGWPAVAACLFARSYFRSPSIAAATGFITSVAALYFVNGNHAALAALAWLAAAWNMRPSLPRWRNFFYIFYPAHLYAIWAWLAWRG